MNTMAVSWNQVCVQISAKEKNYDCCALLIFVVLMLGLNGSIDRLAMASIIFWHAHVLIREDGHVLRRVLGFEVEGQGKIGRPTRT